jgi:hypothetical protein
MAIASSEKVAKLSEVFWCIIGKDVPDNQQETSNCECGG